MFMSLVRLSQLSNRDLDYLPWHVLYLRKKAKIRHAILAYTISNKRKECCLLLLVPN